MTCSVRWIAGWAAVAVCLAPALAMTVTLDPAAPSPLPVGTTIRWNATLEDPPTGTNWYRFRVRQFGGDFQLIRDYGPLASLDWTASAQEGTYEMEVSVRNMDTGEVATTWSVVQMQSLVTEGRPVVTPTLNALVYLYSAPACESGQRMRVDFQGPDGRVKSTPYKDCVSGLSRNFYLAGLGSGTSYTARHLIDTGSELLTGSDVPFSTGNAPKVYADTIIVPPKLPVFELKSGWPTTTSAGT